MFDREQGGIGERSWPAPERITLADLTGRARAMPVAAVDLLDDEVLILREIIAAHVSGRPGWCAAAHCGRLPCWERAAAIGELIALGEPWADGSHAAASEPEPLGYSSLPDGGSRSRRLT